MDLRCRFCLIKTESDNPVNIFTSGIIEKSGEVISEIVRSFTHIALSPEDKFPQLTCTSCLQSLKSVVEFRTLITTSDAKLKSEKIVAKLREAIANAGQPDDVKTGHENEQNSFKVKSRNEIIDDIDNKIEINDHKLNYSIIRMGESPEEVSNDEGQGPERCNKEETDLKSNYSIVYMGRITPVEAIINNEENSVSNKKRPNTLIKKPESLENKKTRVCTECNQIFKNQRQLLAHSYKHKGIMPYKCVFCNKGFRQKHLMLYHSRSHTGERPFKCDKCDKNFRFQASLKAHERIHKNIKPHVCDVCGKSFVQLGGLQVHRRTHTEEKPYICEYCSRKFSGHGNLMGHIGRIHKEKSYELCPICGKSYLKGADMRKHIQRHSNDKNFSCEVCHKQFKNKPSVSMHMRIHNGVKPHKCSLCDKSFTQSSILVRHMRIHSGETPYGCNFCEMKFAYSHHLLKHVKRKHPQES